MARRALVVDNDFFFVEFLSDLLSQHGYEILKAYDGKEGMEQLERETIDILFVDMVMPKIDGQQLIEFTRRKFPERPFSIVAVSATILEHLDDLKEINADFYITKGPMEQMTEQFQSLIGEIDRQPFPDHGEEKIFESGTIFPRREAMELIDSVRFQRAIFDSIGVGILVVDKDARIMSANETVLEILGKESVHLLNRPISAAFRSEARADLVQALKTTAESPARRRIVFTADTGRSVPACITVSLFMLEDKQAGWIVAMAGVEPGDETA